MYSNIDDCDEGTSPRSIGLPTLTQLAKVYNFWEPLHYLDRGNAFQTWETSPQYAIRSWAYILLHALPAKLAGFAFGGEKVCNITLLCFSTYY